MSTENILTEFRQEAAASLQKNTAHLQPMGKWNEEITDQTPHEIISYLNDYLASYQNHINYLKNHLDNESKRQISRRNVTNNSLNELAGSEIQNAESERMRYKMDYKRNEEHFAKQMKDLDSLLTFQSFSSGLRWMFELFLKPLTKGDSATVVDLKNDVVGSRDGLFSKYNKLNNDLDNMYIRSVEKINASKELKLTIFDTEMNDLMSRLHTTNNEVLNTCDRKFTEIIKDVVGREAVKQYLNSIHATVPKIEDFECPMEIPEVFYIGDVVTEVGATFNNSNSIMTSVYEETSQLLKRRDGETLEVRIPYCQNVNEGLSLYVDFKADERAAYQEKLKALLLRMFMSFPAGKLEATLIDPLELGETFTMFAKLGENAPRIIDSKIWSQDSDIEEVINVLREKIETMTHAYGDNKTARIQKEPYRVLAITDFPIGFSQKALQDLQAIIRKSANYGIFVFIWVNNHEMKKQADNMTTFNEISQMLQVCVAKDGNLMTSFGLDNTVNLDLQDLSDDKKGISKVLSSIANGIHNAPRKIEHFTDMYEDVDDINNWFSKDTVNELSIPLGIKGADSIVRMIVGKTNGSTAHHALIAGQTGAGKSTLLHTMIMSTLINYSPDEVQMYLVDFKEGVEFKPYTKYRLPSIKCIAIDSEREFGLNILKELTRELERRADLFSRAGYEEISDFRKATGEKIPKIIMIFDEVQELFRETSTDDYIANECMNLLGKLVTLGRAMGIHIVLACQDFKLIPTIQPLFTSMAIRVAIRGSEQSAKSVLGDGNFGAKQLQDGAAGAAVFNEESGKESANVIFQVGYLKKDKRSEYLENLHSIYSTNDFKELYPGETKILLTNCEDDINNEYNQFIINQKFSTSYEEKDKYKLMIGEGFDLKKKFNIAIGTERRNNILILGRDEKKAASIFYFSMLSLLYGELGNEGAMLDNQLINLIDLSVEDDFHQLDNTSFKHLSEVFSDQVNRVGMKGMDNLIRNTYDILMERISRKRNGNSINLDDERLFLMFFGINRAHKLVSGNMYTDDLDNEISMNAMLNKIIVKGPEYGINSIIWGENLGISKKVLGNVLEQEFAQRIAFDTDDDTMENIVMEHSPKALRNSTAVYMNIDEDVKNKHFRPYDIPAKMWVTKFARAYQDYCDFGGDTNE